MFFCILFNYTILRDTKDVLVVTAPGSGAEIIPFLKTWVNLPMAIGFMFLYGQLANMMSTQTLFYTIIFPFIAFFGAFAFVIYPLRDVIHPNNFCDYILSVIGDRFSAPVAIIRNWSYCLFYVMAELWGSVVVSVLFWVRRPASLCARKPLYLCQSRNVAVLTPFVDARVLSLLGAAFVLWDRGDIPHRFAPDLGSGNQLGKLVQF